MAIVKVPNLTPQNAPLLEDRGDPALPPLMHRTWWLNFNAAQVAQRAIAAIVAAVQQTLLDCVRGALGLLTVGAIPKVTAAGTLGDSSITDNDTLVSSAAPVLVDQGAAPTLAQFEAKANALGALALLIQAADNARLMFDCDLQAGSITAQHAAIVQILKLSGLLRFYSSTGNTIGSPATLTFRACMDLATGNWGFGGNSAPGYPVDVAGDVNVSGAYRKGGAAGESTTLTYVTGLSGVIPAGLTVTTKTVTFSGGIETAHT